jgi:hypothetical protein
MNGTMVNVIIHLCIIFFLAAILVLFVDRNVIVFDEGFMLLGAEKLWHGSTIHRDFYSMYGPGQYGIIAAFFALFGPSVLSERAVGLILEMAAILAVYVILLRFLKTWLAALFALTAALWLASVGVLFSPLLPCLLLSLVSAWLFSLAVSSKTAWKPMFWSGICSGLAVTCRYDIGFALAAAQAGGLVVCACAEPGIRHALQAKIPDMAQLALGFCVVVIPFFGLLAALGALDDLWAQVVRFPAETYAKMRSLPLPRPWIIRDNPREIGTFLPLPIAGLGVWAVAAAIYRKEADRRYLGAITILLLLTLAFIAKAYVRISAVHMSLAIVSGIALLGVVTGNWSREGTMGRALLSAVLVFSITCTLFPSKTNLWWAERNLAWLDGPAPCAVPVGLERLRCFSVDDDMKAAMLYVQSVTAPKTPIYVGLGRHDKILINDVAFYFLADRPSITRWFQMDPGVATTEQIQREIVADLQAARPPYIVLESQWDNLKEPNASAVSSGVTLLDDFIRGRFVPVARFGPISVLQAAR